MIKIQRIEHNITETIGTISIDDTLIGFTLEPPWRMNEPLISSIPTGTYYYEKYNSHKYDRECIRIYSVHNRTNIVIHPGNTVFDTSGCILPGLIVGTLKEKRAVLMSRDCLKLIIDKIPLTGLINIKD